MIDDNLYSFCKNLNALPKLVLLKFTVFLIVVEGLIEQFLVDYSTAIPYDHEDSRHSEDFQALRVYGAYDAALFYGVVPSRTHCRRVCVVITQRSSCW